MKNNNTILLVGGGTGGHIAPVLEIYRRLKDATDIDLIVLGGGTSIEKYFFAGNPDYHILRTGKFHRFLTLRNILEIFYFLFGFCQSLYFLLKFRPVVVFSKGGYVSVPVVFWLRILHIPYFIHESDAEMGASNKYAAKGAQKVFVGFPPENYRYLPQEKLIYSGQLINDEKISGKDDFDFDFDNKPVIFITGGSQGSMIINNAIFGGLPELLEKYNLIHQVGEYGYKKAIGVKNQLSENHKKSYFIKDFLDRIGKYNLMESALSLADIVISRASATTIAEIAKLGKPMLLIPYAAAAADHQSKNAQIFKEAASAVVITERELSKDLLLKKINGLFENKEKAREIGENAKNFFPQGGVRKVVSTLIELFNKKKGK